MYVNGMLVSFKWKVPPLVIVILNTDNEKEGDVDFIAGGDEQSLNRTFRAREDEAGCRWSSTDKINYPGSIL